MTRTAKADFVALNPAALRHIRRITGVGVTTLADEIGVTPGYLSSLESGRRQNVSPTVFRAICTALRLEDVRAVMADWTATAPCPCDHTNVPVEKSQAVA